MHAASLKSHQPSDRPFAQVLTWSAFSPDDYFTAGGAAGDTAYTRTATFTPGSEAVSQMTVTKTNHDMFCPGISMLGRSARWLVCATSLCKP